MKNREHTHKTNVHDSNVQTHTVAVMTGWRAGWQFVCWASCYSLAL